MKREIISLQWWTYSKKEKVFISIILLAFSTSTDVLGFSNRNGDPDVSERQIPHRNQKTER
jgi:hypothetical protein